jgi:hypothetical protein
VLAFIKNVGTRGMPLDLTIAGVKLTCARSDNISLGHPSFTDVTLPSFATWKVLSMQATVIEASHRNNARDGRYMNAAATGAYGKTARCSILD